MAKDIYQILKMQTLLSPRLARDMSEHRSPEESSHVDQRQGEESGEKVMNPAMPQVHGPSSDTRSSLRADHARAKTLTKDI